MHHRATPGAIFFPPLTHASLKKLQVSSYPVGLTYSHPASDQTYLMKLASTFQVHHLRPNNNIFLANRAFFSSTFLVHATIFLRRLEAQHPTQACSFIRFKVEHMMFAIVPIPA
jgi:hypothetical protein